MAEAQKTIVEMEAEIKKAEDAAIEKSAQEAATEISKETEKAKEAGEKVRMFLL